MKAKREPFSRIIDGSPQKIYGYAVLLCTYASQIQKMLRIHAETSMQSCRQGFAGEQVLHAPVMWRAAGEQRNTAAMAMSHLEPTRPIGIVAATNSFTSSSDASTPASFDTPGTTTHSPCHHQTLLLPWPEVAHHKQSSRCFLCLDLGLRKIDQPL